MGQFYYLYGIRFLEFTLVLFLEAFESKHITKHIVNNVLGHPVLYVSAISIYLQASDSNVHNWSGGLIMQNFVECYVDVLHFLIFPVFGYHAWPVAIIYPTINLLT